MNPRVAHRSAAPEIGGLTNKFRHVMRLFMRKVTLSISLPGHLRDRVQAAAEADGRTVSNWSVKVFEAVLREIDARAVAEVSGALKVSGPFGGAG